jgi:NAD(P)-dependent dehydrogenase (short-subunit alcohol dehydrogenase family)
MTEKSRKLCVVTGANAGIGRAAARKLAERGARVVMVCRDAQRGEAARAEIAASTRAKVELMVADLGNQDAVRELARTLLEEHPRIDTLVHNAAVFDISQKEPRITADGHELVWAVNHLGPFLLTHLLRERLEDSAARIITISSKGLIAHPFLKLDFDDLDSRSSFSASRAYYRSKIAQCMFTVELARRLKRATAYAIRVPAVQVSDERLPNISPFLLWVYKQKRKSSITPEQMAQTYLFVTLEDEAKELAGKHVDEKHQVVSFPSMVGNTEARERLWKVSEEQVRRE